MGILEKVMRKFGYAPVSTLGAAPDMLAALEAVKKHMADEDVTARGVTVWFKVCFAIEKARNQK